MKLKNSNRFFLQGTGERFLHLATVEDSLREFICFTDRVTGKVYIEEMTAGNLEWIEDDSLHEALNYFLVEKKILDPANPFLPDKQWLSHPLNKKYFS